MPQKKRHREESKMTNTWIMTEKICKNPKCKYVANQIYPACGITMDNNGTIYFTTGEYESVYQVKQDTKPQILVNIKEAVLLGVVWNANNNTLYICDIMNHRIVSYSIDTGNISTVAGGDGWGHEDGDIKDARFWNPTGIAMDRNCDLYITELRHVRKINMSSGTVITIAGSDKDDGRESGHRDGEANQALFEYCYGITVGDDGTIYVTDDEDHSIRKVKEGIVSTIAGTPGKRGFQLHNSMFARPRAIVLDVDGNLLVGDKNGLRRVDLHHQRVSTLESDLHIISMCKINAFELLVGTFDEVWKFEHSWKWKRWVWIGHLKENPCDCLLSTLPRDIIKAISSYLSDIETPL